MSKVASRKMLARRLRERSSEIAQATLARAHAVSDPVEVKDPEYALGLKEAVGIAVDYGVDEIESTGGAQAPIPDRLLSQARAAARNNVGLDTVLRRYFAGYTLLADFLIEEARQCGSIQPEELQAALRANGALIDRVVVSISAEYAREAEGRLPNAERRRAELVRMLLAAESVDPAELHYELEAWHLALIASGPGAEKAVRDLVSATDCNLLLTPADEGAVWAWLGARKRLSAGEILRLAECALSEDITLALGEPGRGIDGWRLTHRQAKAAMLVADRGRERRVRYADVALLASALRDDVLARSLRDFYLAPLERSRDGGMALRETLTAYFSAGRNVSATAAALGVSRQTVSGRLRAVEEHVDRLLDTCVAELETSLRLDSLSNRQAR
jgi:hypothetical protein